VHLCHLQAGLADGRDRAEASREVSWEEAERFSKENDMLFVQVFAVRRSHSDYRINSEVSNLTGENTTQPFYLLSRAILVAIENGQIDPSSATSGVSFGERSLQRVNSWSGLRPNQSRLGNCC
jgi:Ras-related protein Rab-4B